MMYEFRIADFTVRITFTEGQYNSLRFVPSFLPFEVPLSKNGENDGNILFALTVDDELAVVPKEKRHRIRVFDTGNGDVTVDKLENGGYQFIVKDVKQRECALLITDKLFTVCRCALNGDVNMRTYGLNNVLMLCFAYASVNHQTLLIHASLVRHEQKAYAFIAKSGTGKSTQVSMWMQHIPQCDIMNDDNPIVRLIDGKIKVYGGPWSGKTPCYRNVQCSLDAVIRVDRAQQNSIEKLSPVEAFISVLTACASMKWDEDIWDRVCNNVTKLIERVPCYILHCLPNEEAAHICHSVIHK